MPTVTIQASVRLKDFVCGNCPNFKVIVLENHLGKVEVGHCHFAPPKRSDGNSGWWPVTTADEFCGQHPGRIKMTEGK